MTPSKLTVSALLAAALPVFVSVGYAQPATKSSSAVPNALGVLNRVVGHTQRLIDAKNFARLPHEDGEFKEGVEALEKAIARKPADFKQKVEPLIQQAEARSHGLAAASSKPDLAALNSAHEALAKSVDTLIATFPETDRPISQAPAGTK